MGLGVEEQEEIKRENTRENTRGDTRGDKRKREIIYTTNKTKVF
jgi:hypothetical protein